MEDARKRNEEMKSDFKELSPKEVLARLQRGNARFWTGNAVRPEKSAFERRALIMQQFPLTAVLGCSDSRVPVEVIFDQGLGDMFVVRVAGNCLDTAPKASLQYAVHHLKVKVLVVMGHEGCGAVKAAQLPIEQINKEPEALSNALKMMKAGLDENRLANIHDTRSYDREAVVTNIRRQVEGLCQDAAIMQKVIDEELIVVGCFYEISSGIVDFFMEVTEALDDTPKLVLQGVSAGVQSRIEYSAPKQIDAVTGEASPVRRLETPRTNFVLPARDAAPVKVTTVSSFSLPKEPPRTSLTLPETPRSNFVLPARDVTAVSSLSLPKEPARTSLTLPEPARTSLTLPVGRNVSVSSTTASIITTPVFPGRPGNSFVSPASFAQANLKPAMYTWAQPPAA